VLDEASQERIKINIKEVKENQLKLAKISGLSTRLHKALEIMDKHRQSSLMTSEQDVDSQLYDGFFPESDRATMGVVRAADYSDVGAVNLEFTDDRLNKLLPLYKARNFPAILSSEEREAWEKFRYHKLVDGGVQSPLSKYFIRLSELMERKGLSNNQKYLLEELQLYGESIMPEPTDE